jgi:hypothetical protein
MSTSLRLRPPEVHLTLNGRTILFVDHVKYLGVIFNKSIKWRLHIEMIEAKAIRTFIRVYSLFAGHGSRAIACFLFARSEAVTVGSNPTQGIYV